MNDFFNDLKEIKKELEKKESNLAKKEAKESSNQTESKYQREERLKSEFIEYMKRFDK